MMWLNQAAEQIFGIDDALEVPPAPPKESLIEFGGTMTRNEFQKCCGNKTSFVYKIEKPLLTFPMKLINERVGSDLASEQLSTTGMFETFLQEDVEPKLQDSKKLEKTDDARPVPKKRKSKSKCTKKQTKKPKKTTLKKYDSTKSKKKQSKKTVKKKPSVKTQTSIKNLFSYSA